MNVVYSFVAANTIFNFVVGGRKTPAATIEIHFYYIKTYLKGLKDNRFQSFWCLFGVY